MSIFQSRPDCKCAERPKKLWPTPWQQPASRSKLRSIPPQRQCVPAVRRQCIFATKRTQIEEENLRERLIEITEWMSRHPDEARTIVTNLAKH